MQSLEEMRKELDVIDDQITTLYERRMKVCEGVAEYKIKNGRKVFDKTRENEKLAAVAEKVSTDFNKKGIRELFEQLMSMSRKLQYQRLSEEGVLGRLPFIGLDQLDLDGARVVFQGVEGANNQAAMLKTAMYRHSVMQWKQLKREAQIMQSFQLKILPQVR